MNSNFFESYENGMRTHIKRGKHGARFTVRVVFGNDALGASEADLSGVEINVFM